MSLEGNYASRPNSSIEVKSVELIPSIQGGLREQGTNAYTEATDEVVEPRRIGKVRRPGDASGTVTGISTDSPNGEQWSAKIIPFCCIFNENNLVGVNNKQFPIAKIPIEVGRNTLGNYHHAKIIGYVMNTSTRGKYWDIDGPKQPFLIPSPSGPTLSYLWSYTNMFKAKIPITYDFANPSIGENGFKPKPKVATSELEMIMGFDFLNVNDLTPPNAIANLPSSISNQYQPVYTYATLGPTSNPFNMEGKTGAGGNYNANWDDAQISDTDTARFDLVLTFNFIDAINPHTNAEDTYWGKIKGLVTLY